MEPAAVLEYIRNFYFEYEAVFRAVALGSLAFFLLTPILAPAAIVLMAPDALVRHRIRLRDRRKSLAVLYLAWHLIKNVLGIGLMGLGFLLLFMPGQGLLTIFIGVLLTDLPGRRKMLIRLLGSGKIRPVVDRLRERYRREALIWPGM